MTTFNKLGGLLDQDFDPLLRRAQPGLQQQALEADRDNKKAAIERSYLRFVTPTGYDSGGHQRRKYPYGATTRRSSLSSAWRRSAYFFFYVAQSRASGSGRSTTRSRSRARGPWARTSAEAGESSVQGILGVAGRTRAQDPRRAGSITHHRRLAGRRDTPTQCSIAGRTSGRRSSSKSAASAERAAPAPLEQGRGPAGDGSLDRGRDARGPAIRATALGSCAVGERCRRAGSEEEVGARRHKRPPPLPQTLLGPLRAPAQPVVTFSVEPGGDGGKSGLEKSVARQRRRRGSPAHVPARCTWTSSVPTSTRGTSRPRPQPNERREDLAAHLEELTSLDAASIREERRYHTSLQLGANGAEARRAHESARGKTHPHVGARRPRPDAPRAKARCRPGASRVVKHGSHTTLQSYAHGPGTAHTCRRSAGSSVRPGEE